VVENEPFADVSEICNHAHDSSAPRQPAQMRICTENLELLHGPNCSLHHRSKAGNGGVELVFCVGLSGPMFIRLLCACLGHHKSDSRRSLDAAVALVSSNSHFESFFPDLNVTANPAKLIAKL